MLEKENNINWSTMEFNYRKKGGDWFWHLASAGLIIIIIAILLKNFLLAFLALIASLIMGVVGAAKPKLINFSIGPRGVAVSNHLFPFKELESFCLNYDPPFKKELILKRKKKLAQAIKIPLADTDPVLVRKFLLKVLKEEEFEESLLDLMAEKIGI